MRVLGRVVAVSKSGRLIVRVDQPPPIGSRVYDDRLALIGEVYDVMGPVSSPYVSVKPLIELNKVSSFVGRVLYVETRKPTPRRRRRRRR